MVSHYFIDHWLIMHSNVTLKRLGFKALIPSPVWVGRDHYVVEGLVTSVAPREMLVQQPPYTAVRGELNSF